MGKLIGIGTLLIMLGVIGFVFFSKDDTSSPSVRNSLPNSQTSTPQSTDINASFAIFTNNTFRIFTASMYHNLSEDVYIEASNPNIVHVKKTGTTWNDFFSTLPVKLTSTCLTTGTKETFCTGERGTLQFYINGQRNDSALSQEIREGDKLLVTFGNESDETIQKQFDSIR